jgi:hypothetical protein
MRFCDILLPTIKFCEIFLPEARQKIAAGNAASTFATVQDFPFDEWLKRSVIPSDLDRRIAFFG